MYRSRRYHPPKKREGEAEVKLTKMETTKNAARKKRKSRLNLQSPSSTQPVTTVRGVKQQVDRAETTTASRHTGILVLD